MYGITEWLSYVSQLAWMVMVLEPYGLQTVHTFWKTWFYNGLDYIVLKGIGYRIDIIMTYEEHKKRSPSEIFSHAGCASLYVPVYIDCEIGINVFHILILLLQRYW